MDPPYGEDRYAYKPAPLKHTTRSASATKGVVITPPICIEPTEAVKIDKNERLRDSVVMEDPNEITVFRNTDEKPEINKNVKEKEVIKTQKKLSSDEQDRNNMRIEKLRKAASNSRQESNEFSTLFFSPPKKASSKDSGSSRKNSKLEQRRNTPETIPLSRKDDKQKLGQRIEEKTVSGKQISSAPILILSDAETGHTVDHNKSPEILPDRSQDQRKIFIIPLSEAPTDLSKRAVSTSSLKGDRNKAREHDNTQISIERELTPMKYFPKDTIDVAKQESNKPSAPLSDNLISDVTESQQDIIESEKGSLVMSPITEIIIPPVGKIIKHSQTDNLVKDKSESFDETRKHSSPQLTNNGNSDPSKIIKENILKEPIKIEKLRGPKTVKTKLSDDNDKGMSLKNERKSQGIDEPRISTRLSEPTELLDIIKQPVRRSKENSAKKEEQKISQNSVIIPDHFPIDGEIQTPTTKQVDTNQYQSKEGKKNSDQMKIVEHTKEDDVLKNNYPPSLSPDRTDISVKTKNENTQLQLDQPKTESLVIAQNRDSIASGYKKITDSEITMKPHQSLNKEFRKSLQLQEHHNKSDQLMITEEVQKLRYMPEKKTEPHQPIIALDFPNANYQEVNSNQNHYPSAKQGIKITSAYDINEQQLLEPIEEKDLEGKTHALLDNSQVSTKGVNRDDHYINLVFKKYTYDNKTGIKTLDADANFEPDESIVTYKSNSHTQDKKITIPIDEQNVMDIKIKQSSSTGKNDGKVLEVPRFNIRRYLFNNYVVLNS